VVPDIANAKLHWFMFGIIEFCLHILGKLDSINKPIMEISEELSAFLNRDRNGHGHFGMVFRIEARIMAIICIEGGHFNGVLVCIIVGEFCQWEEIIPIILLVIAIQLQVLLQDLVHVFRLSICLRMECCR